MLISSIIIIRVIKSAEFIFGQLLRNFLLPNFMCLIFVFIVINLERGGLQSLLLFCSFLFDRSLFLFRLSFFYHHLVCPRRRSWH